MCGFILLASVDGSCETETQSRSKGNWVKWARLHKANTGQTNGQSNLVTQAFTFIKTGHHLHECFSIIQNHLHNTFIQRHSRLVSRNSSVKQLSENCKLQEVDVF